MIATLVAGRHGSKGLPGKNTMPLLGRPLAWYAMRAAKQASRVDRIYVSTDSPKIRAIGESLGAFHIERPASLATDESLLEDVLLHGFEHICRDLGQSPEMMVVLLCNAATVSSGTIDHAVDILRADPTADSAATVNHLNQYSPVRAKSIVNGLLTPALDHSQFGDAVTCDRSCLGDVYFCDASMWVLRPICMDYSKGQPPFRWMGSRILPIIGRGGLDVDDEEGLAATEIWLRRHGFSETQTPYDDKS